MPITVRCQVYAEDGDSLSYFPVEFRLKLNPEQMVSVHTALMVSIKQLESINLNRPFLDQADADDVQDIKHELGILEHLARVLRQRLDQL